MPSPTSTSQGKTLRATVGPDFKRDRERAASIVGFTKNVTILEGENEDATAPRLREDVLPTISSGLKHFVQIAAVGETRSRKSPGWNCNYMKLN